MKRFFYTDLLAAAWMAKHFGMRFWSGDHEIHLLPFVDSQKKGRWLLHPDSLLLLEPRAGDLLTGRNRKVFMIYEGGESLPHARVVERNGIAFMWPESERASP
jgi:hypothetical protein